MRDILVNTPVSLVIIDKITTKKKKDLKKNDLHGFRMIMCLINKVRHAQASQSVTHSNTNSLLHPGISRRFTLTHLPLE